MESIENGFLGVECGLEWNHDEFLRSAALSRKWGWEVMHGGEMTGNGECGG